MGVCIRLRGTEMSDSWLKPPAWFITYTAWFSSVLTRVYRDCILRSGTPLPAAPYIYATLLLWGGDNSFFLTDGTRAPNYMAWRNTRRRRSSYSPTLTASSLSIHTWPHLTWLQSSSTPGALPNTTNFLRRHMKLTCKKKERAISVLFI